MHVVIRILQERLCSCVSRHVGHPLLKFDATDGLSQISGCKLEITAKLHHATELRRKNYMTVMLALPFDQSTGAESGRHSCGSR